jgi:phage-related minor tail protein
MQTQAEKNLNELEDIYQWAREVLAERLIVLKRQVSDNLSREEKDSQIKLGEIREQSLRLEEMREEIIKGQLTGLETEIEIL